eukprot:GFUD01007383.1.p1 GENE.GFUD01007383.1~~GFUD01007383.1.p1  ORF type:complete len:948 (+),score=147.14 GFUD01007383.1:408-3251(+)
MMHFDRRLVFVFVCGLCAAEPISTMTPDEATALTVEGVLEHVVIYEPLPPAPEYKSDDSFDPRGMEHVYLLVNTFLDLIQRKNVLPKSINTSLIAKTISGNPEDAISFLTTHWQDILLQYIGVLTAAIFGLLLAIIIPTIGFFFCCCRCAGKCGAYPETHYDKKSDACKRVSLGILLSGFVIAVVFGTVSAFVTNHYTYSGWNGVSKKIDASLEDAGGYFQHTGESIEVLLVTNFAEMEEVIGDILDDSGPILKKKLADITEAIAIDDLTSIVSGLGKVKKNLISILSDTRTLDDKVNQLRDGLSRSQKDLTSALQECNSNTACANFLQEFDLDKDLAMAEDFIKIEFKMPEVTGILSDISELIESDIEEKVKNGKAKMDNLEGEIEGSIEDIKPKVKSEIRAMGLQLEKQNNAIQSALREIDVAVLQKDVPQIDDHTLVYVKYRYYVGLGMASLILLILFCFVMGLFYGMCGRRPGGLYGDDCCNRGTGANFLATAVYFTFLFSFVLLVLTTGHFVLGAAVEKVICETLKSPEKSDVFGQFDRQYLQPRLNEVLNEASNGKNRYSAAGLIEKCHANETIYSILKLDKIYNISKLTDWRTNYGIGEYIENLKNKIQLEQLSRITLLSPETSKDLEELAKSKISDMDFSKFTTLLENEITKIDLDNFIDRLKVLKDQVYRFDSTRSIAPKLENEALWLGTMNKVVEEMKSTVRHLKKTVAELEENSKFNHTSMREAINSLLSQANRATEMIQKDGPELISSLTDQYVTETVEIIDEYVDRVIDSIRYEVGFCAPLSTSYNATVVAICHEVVDPFNGFWASIGWCFLLYIPCIALSLSLISLYRKCEPYPGPLVETQPLHTEPDKKSRRKGHTRNASGYLPEYTHARPPPQMQGGQGRFRDIAPSNWDRESSQPPRYTSNPTLTQNAPAGEYERPPPYYYPGPQPSGSK